MSQQLRTARGRTDAPHSGCAGKQASHTLTGLTPGFQNQDIHHHVLQRIEEMATGHPALRFEIRYSITGYTSIEPWYDINVC